MRAFHGTNQVFDKFQLAPVVRSTHGASAASGIFFTTLPQVAEQYARMAHGKLYAGDHAAREAAVAALVEKYERLSNAGKYDQAEKVLEEAEKLESEARDEISGAHVLEVQIDTTNPLIIPNAGRVDLHTMADQLASAFAAGHDAVIYEDIWDPASLETVAERYDHVIVRDPDLIRILSVREIATETEEERPSFF